MRVRWESVGYAPMLRCSDAPMLRCSDALGTWRISQNNFKISQSPHMRIMWHDLGTRNDHKTTRQRVLYIALGAVVLNYIILARYTPFCASYGKVTACARVNLGKITRPTV